jgi:hypothetical protein
MHALLPLGKTVMFIRRQGSQIYEPAFSWKISGKSPRSYDIITLVIMPVSVIL